MSANKMHAKFHNDWKHVNTPSYFLCKYFLEDLLCDIGNVDVYSVVTVNWISHVLWKRLA